MRFIGVLILIVLLVAAGQGARRLALRSWNAVVKYRTPFAAPVARAPAAPPLARRVVLVVADGLREDASRRMPVLATLRERGASFVSIAGQPSLSLPGWTMIATGAPQEISGVTTNWYEGAVEVDSLFASAKDAGVRTAVVGSPGWQDLFGRWVTAGAGFPDPPEGSAEERVHAVSAAVTSAALRLLAGDPARLIVVHLPSPDLMGHAFGGASPQYAEAARRVDQHIGQILQRLDPASDALVVTADHGHLDTGGHGGWEPVVLRTPLVLAGAGIRRLAGGVVGQQDIAPTVALLLGIPVPAHSAGRPLVEAMALPAGYTGEDSWIEQARRFHDAYADTIGAPRYADRVIARGGSSPEALADALDAARAAARERRLDAERLRRLPLALLAAAAALAYLVLHRRKAAWGPPLVGLAAYLAVYAILFFGRGYTWSLSVFNREDLIEGFFTARTYDAMLAAAVGTLAAGLAARRRPWGEAALAGVQAAYLIVAALVVQVLYMYWRWDVTFSWYLPDLRPGFKYYLDLLQLIALGYVAAASPVLAALGKAIGGLFRRRPIGGQISYTK